MRGNSVENVFKLVCADTSCLLIQKCFSVVKNAEKCCYQVFIKKDSLCCGRRRALRIGLLTE